MVVFTGSCLTLDVVVMLGILLLGDRRREMQKQGIEGGEEFVPRYPVQVGRTGAKNTTYEAVGGKQGVIKHSLHLLVVAVASSSLPVLLNLDNIHLITESVHGRVVHGRS